VSTSCYQDKKIQLDARAARVSLVSPRRSVVDLRARLRGCSTCSQLTLTSLRPSTKWGFWLQKRGCVSPCQLSRRGPCLSPSAGQRAWAASAGWHRYLGLPAAGTATTPDAVPLRFPQTHGAFGFPCAVSGSRKVQTRNPWAALLS